MVVGAENVATIALAHQHLLHLVLMVSYIQPELLIHQILVELAEVAQLVQIILHVHRSVLGMIMHLGIKWDLWVGFSTQEIAHAHLVLLQHGVAILDTMDHQQAVHLDVLHVAAFRPVLDYQHLVEQTAAQEIHLRQVVIYHQGLHQTAPEFFLGLFAVIPS